MAAYWQQFLEAIQYRTIVETILATLQFLADQFFLLVQHAPWVFAVYICVLVFLFFVAKKIYAGFQKMKQTCTYEIDKVHFKFALLLYNHREEIYDFANTITILYAHKKEILADPSKTFLSDVELLQKDVQYLEQLLGLKIVSDDQRTTIITMRDLVYKGRYMYLTLMSLLTVLTVGIAAFFTKRVEV